MCKVVTGAHSEGFVGQLFNLHTSFGVPETTCQTVSLHVSESAHGLCIGIVCVYVCIHVCVCVCVYVCMVLYTGCMFVCMYAFGWMDGWMDGIRKLGGMISGSL